MLAKAWTYTPEDALAFYGSNSETGLTAEQVTRNRESFGENCKLRPRWDLTLRLTLSSTRIPPDLIIQAHPRSISRPASLDSPRFRCRLVHPGAV